MTKRKLRKIAKDSIKAGPAMTFDNKGNPYQAYVMFIRDGIRYTVVVIDEDIAMLNGPTIDFMIAEAAASLEGMGLDYNKLAA